LTDFSEVLTASIKVMISDSIPEHSHFHTDCHENLKSHPPQVVDGDSVQIWRVNADMLKKQS
jgi:hypothetical protein